MTKLPPVYLIKTLLLNYLIQNRYTVRLKLLLINKMKSCQALVSKTSWVPLTNTLICKDVGACLSRIFFWWLKWSKEPRWARHDDWKSEASESFFRWLQTSKDNIFLYFLHHVQRQSWPLNREIKEKVATHHGNFTGIKSMH